MCRSVKSENVVEFIPESHHRHYCLIEAGAPADVQRSKSNSNQKTPNNSTSRTRHNRHTSFNVFRLFFLRKQNNRKMAAFVQPSRSMPVAQSNRNKRKVCLWLTPKESWTAQTEQNILTLWTNRASSFIFNQKSSNFMPFDSSWNDLQNIFWHQHHLTERSAVKSPKHTSSVVWWSTFVILFQPIASPDHIGVKRLLIEDFMDYLTVCNMII